MAMKIVHQSVMDRFHKKMNVMLVAVETQVFGARGILKNAMLTVVMETDVVTGLANRILTLMSLILIVNQSAMDPMKTLKLATQDAVNRKRSGGNGLDGAAM